MPPCSVVSPGKFFSFPVDKLSTLAILKPKQHLNKEDADEAPEGNSCLLHKLMSANQKIKKDQNMKKSNAT